MTEAYYSQSYPPSLWESLPPVTAAAAGRTADGNLPPMPESAYPADAVDLPPATSSPSPELVVNAGKPGQYWPAVKASERPRNVTELGQRAQPSQPDPWPAGAYVLVGENGKRAHWTGDHWRGGDSPGYPAPEGPGDVEFPGLDDSPQDQHR